MIARLMQDDSSVPYRYKDHHYYTRFETGKQYSVHARGPAGGGPEQLLVDSNREAEGKDYYAVAARSISPEQDLLAFTEDTGELLRSFKPGWLADDLDVRTGRRRILRCQGPAIRASRCARPSKEPTRRPRIQVG